MTNKNAETLRSYFRRVGGHMGIILEFNLEEALKEACTLEARGQVEVRIVAEAQQALVDAGIDGKIMVVHR